MGTNFDRADPQDHPQHTVRLPEYRIDKYLVTNAQYARFLAATGHRPPSTWKNGRIQDGQLLYPVTLVNWYDASAYAHWAGKRLPTEAEWEKAARGTDGRRWPWGNTMDPKRLNTYYNVGSATNVDTYKNGVSPYGVFDMAGNVSEWVEDDFLPYDGAAMRRRHLPGQGRKSRNRRRSGNETIRADSRQAALQGAARRLVEERSVLHGGLPSQLRLAQLRLGLLRFPLRRRCAAPSVATAPTNARHCRGVRRGRCWRRRVAWPCCVAPVDALPYSASVNSYRFLHVTIDTPWHIFLFLLIGIFAPFILMVVLMWRNSARKRDLAARSQAARRGRRAAGALIVVGRAAAVHGCRVALPAAPACRTCCRPRGWLRRVLAVPDVCLVGLCLPALAAEPPPENDGARRSCSPSSTPPAPAPAADAGDQTRRWVMFGLGAPLLILLLVTGALGIAMGDRMASRYTSRT